MKSLAHLYTRIIDTPLAVHPAKFDIWLSLIGSRLGFEVSEEQIEAAKASPKSKEKLYQVANGIAIIPITGSLMKKTSGLMLASGSTSYEAIAAQYQDAMTNSAIKGVMLDCDSPGGETSGLFELAELMAKVKGDKPVYAIVDDSAYSAAYAIACVADQIYLTRTAGVGSIGVFCCHIDQSGADKQDGKKYTFIFAGEKKVDGNAHAPLSKSAESDTQVEVNRLYGMFVSLVAKNRGVAAAKIQQTEAGVYHGENAVPLLADYVGTFEDAFGDLLAVTQAGSAGKAVKATGEGHNIALLNNNIVAEMHAEEQKETMAKDLTIDELVAQAAAKQSASDEEEMKKSKKADDEDEDEDDKKKKNDEDEDEDEDDKKKKNDEDEDDEEAKKGKKATASRDDAVHIVNLCTLAGMPELASKFLAADFSATEVTKALMKHRAGESRKVKVASTSAPANDFASVASQIQKDKTIKHKAEAFAAYLRDNPKAYVDSMLNRNTGNKSGENYLFLKQRGY